MICFSISDTEILFFSSMSLFFLVILKPFLAILKTFLAYQIKRLFEPCHSPFSLQL